MKVCPNCGRELNDKAKFCDACGTPAVEKTAPESVPAEAMLCPACGAAVCEGAAFCESCGAALGSDAEGPEVTPEPEAEPEPEPEVEPEPEPEIEPEAAPEKKKSGKKGLIIGIAAAAAVLVLGVIAAIIAIIAVVSKGSDAERPYGLYIKDREIYFTDFARNSSPWQITNRLVDAPSDEVSSEDLKNAGRYLGVYTCISEDGKLIFFPDKVGDDDGFNLYYRELSDPEGDIRKIDSGILYYMIDSSAENVTYIKGEEGYLYRYNIAEENKEKIGSDVEGFIVSEDGNRILYINAENSLYIKIGDEDREKLAGEIENLEHVDAEITTVYYTKEGSLYKQVIGEDREKISSDVYNVVSIYESGEIYFVKKTVEEIPLSAFVNDDMASADKELYEMEYPKSPNPRDFATAEEYDAAYNKYLEEFEACEANNEQYWNKLDRDELRAELAGETVEIENHSLFYYNGQEVSVVTDGLGYYENNSVAAENAVIVYFAGRGEPAKVKLSEVEWVYDLRSAVESALEASYECFVAVKGESTPIQQDDACAFDLSSDGDELYFIDNVPEESEYGDLYCVTIEDGVVSHPVVRDSDVYIYRNDFVGDSMYSYFKNQDEDIGELYINGKKIDDDVYVYGIDYRADSGELYYYIDWNEERECGTLKLYRGEELFKVGDDVYDYTVLPDGRVLFMFDYSLNYFKGELHLWDNGESEKIDDDVVVLLPVYRGGIRGVYFN